MRPDKQENALFAIIGILAAIMIATFLLIVFYKLP